MDLPISTDKRSPFNVCPGPGPAEGNKGFEVPPHRPRDVTSQDSGHHHIRTGIQSTGGGQDPEPQGRDRGGTDDRHTYDAEKRQALEAWEVELEQILAGKMDKDGKVIDIRKVQG
ncbi:MAG: hypothetical protein U5L00_10965 [Desulfovermiculus sp.]|nr:hypothetical protein [Desulfovermiculus sp.]